MSPLKKLIYSIGAVGAGLLTGLVSGFILIYNTDAVGLNSGIVSTLISIALIFDSITDLSFGTILGKTETKWGKARPWVFISIIPLCLCEVLLFSTPSMAQIWQYIYFFVFYVVLNAGCKTVNGIAFSAMALRMTPNDSERVTMGAVTSIMTTVLGLVQSSIALSMATAFGGGVTGWRTVAIIFSVIGLVLMIPGVIFCKELSPEELGEVVNGNHVEIETPKEKKHYLRDVFSNYKQLITNKYAVMIVVLGICTIMMTGGAVTVLTYYVSWVVANENLMVVFTLSMMGPMILSNLLSPFFVKKLGMYRANWLTMFAAFVFAILSMICGFAGLFIPMIILMVLRSLSAGIFSPTVNAVIGRVSEYTLLKDGTHIEAVILGCNSFGNKIGASIIIAVCGWCLSFAGYDGLAAAQTPAALNMISFLFLGLPAIFIGVEALILKMMKVDKDISELKASQVD